MKKLNILFIILFTTFLFSCSLSQSQSFNNINGYISIITLDTSEIFKWMSIDTKKATMSGDHFKGPGEIPSSWNIYLPYGDSLIITIKNINGIKIYNQSNFLKKGYYKISLYPNFHLNNYGIYLITSNFCDSIFVRKFLIPK